MAGNGLSSNWKKLQASLKEDSPSGVVRGSLQLTKSKEHGIKRKRAVMIPQQKTSTGSNPSRSRKRFRMSGNPITEGDRGASDGHSLTKTASTLKAAQVDCINGGLHTGIEVGKYLALDCEMVGIGPAPHLESALARISIVNYNGGCVYDSYVKPLDVVTDWRTHVSGIAPKHMIHARTLEQVQNDVSALIKDKVLVGHSIRGDFDALLLSHPMRDIRDTARHPPYRKLAGGGSPKLKILASELLGLDIQDGEHSSIEDARATMLLFRRDKDAFEREHAKKWPVRVVPVKQIGEAEQNKKPKKKKKKKR